MSKLCEDQITRFDPMGLLQLHEAVTALAALNALENSSSSMSEAIAKVEDCLHAITTRYDLLKDRYALLKRTNAALSDELQWLRDQLDDLCAEPHAKKDREQPI